MMRIPNRKAPKQATSLSIDRVVVPLIKRTAATKKPIKNLMPVVLVEGHEFIMVVPQLAAIATTDLGIPIGSAAQHRDEVVAALDFLITGI